MKIPISAAKEIAQKFDYDQVVIIARKVGANEHVTTYGKDKAHCKIAADIGDFLKFKVMKWAKDGDRRVMRVEKDGDGKLFYVGRDGHIVWITEVAIHHADVVARGINYLLKAERESNGNV